MSSPESNVRGAEHVEPRRRTVRTSAASGHHVRTVAGLPRVGGTHRVARPNQGQETDASTGQADNSIAVADPRTESPRPQNILDWDAAADTCDAADTGSVTDTLNRRRGDAVMGPFVDEAVDDEAACRQRAPQPQSGETGTKSHPAWTYATAGVVVSVLFFVATRPIWDNPASQAPPVVHEDMSTEANPQTVTPAPQEYVALPPASTSPGELGDWQLEEPGSGLSPSGPATEPDQPTLAHRAAHPSQTAPRREAENEKPWELDAAPRVANRPTAETTDNGPTPGENYPSTSYPVLTPSVTDASPKPLSGSADTSGDARLDGHIEPFQSDES